MSNSKSEEQVKELLQKSSEQVSGDSENPTAFTTQTDKGDNVEKKVEGREETSPEAESSEEEELSDEEQKRRQAFMAFLAKYYTKEGEKLKRLHEMAESAAPHHAPERFTIFSWNLDGLDDEDLKERTNAVIDIIMLKSPAIVFLQELIPRTYIHIFNALSSKYLAIPGTDFPPAGYHTATFINFHQVRHLDHYIKPFPNSGMGRNLLVTKVLIGQVKVALLNTHLESMLPSSEERVAQLKTCFQVAQSFPPEYNVLFGGDLNLRDWEVGDLIPKDMCDLWVEHGSWASTKYTWDLQKNTNKEMDCEVQPRKRFDRFYFRHSFPSTMTSVYFGLDGKEEVEGTESFPSDHFAIVTQFRFADKAKQYFRYNVGRNK